MFVCNPCSHRCADLTSLPYRRADVHLCPCGNG